MRMLTLERAATALSLGGVALTWSTEFEAYRVAPMGAVEAYAEYEPDLAEAYGLGQELAATIAHTAASFVRAFHVPATAARVAALSTFR